MFNKRKLVDKMTGLCFNNRLLKCIIDSRLPKSLPINFRFYFIIVTTLSNTKCFPVFTQRPFTPVYLCFLPPNFFWQRCQPAFLAEKWTVLSQASLHFNADNMVVVDSSILKEFSKVANSYYSNAGSRIAHISESARLIA